MSNVQGMEAPQPKRLRVWQEWTQSSLPELLDRSATPSIAHHTHLAKSLYLAEALMTSGQYDRQVERPEPYTLEWFQSIERYRHGRYARWICKLMEFSKHPGESLLALGRGLGTDWVPYARHNARVIICSPRSDQLQLVRRNFELRGLRGKFLKADPGCLPLEDASIDVVSLQDFDQEAGEPEQLISEVYRVLKPGGKVLAVAPAYYDIDFWYGACFPWQRWLDRDSNDASRHGQQYTTRSLRKLFHRFIEYRVHRRQLRRADVPHVWRWVPRSLLERMMGRNLLLKAFKPVSAAIALHSAPNEEMAA